MASKDRICNYTWETQDGPAEHRNTLTHQCGQTIPAGQNSHPGSHVCKKGACGATA